MSLISVPDGDSAKGDFCNNDMGKVLIVTKKDRGMELIEAWN